MRTSSYDRSQQQHTSYVAAATQTQRKVVMMDLAGDEDGLSVDNIIPDSFFSLVDRSRRISFNPFDSLSTHTNSDSVS